MRRGFGRASRAIDAERETLGAAVGDSTRRENAYDEGQFDDANGDPTGDGPTAGAQDGSGQSCSRV